MPEAVSSNTTRTLDSQDTGRISSHIADRFEDVGAMFEAFNTMNCAVLDDQAGHPTGFSYGMSLLQKLIVADLGILRAEVSEHLKTLMTGRELVSPIDSDLLSRIATMRIDAYREAGREISDDTSQWNEDDDRDIFRRAGEQYIDLQTKLEGCRHLIDAGSMLPWLELRIRREVGLTTGSETTEIPDEPYSDPGKFQDTPISEGPIPDHFRAEMDRDWVRRDVNSVLSAKAITLKPADIERVIDQLLGERQVENPATRQKAV